MVEKYRDCTREWNKEVKALKKMTTPGPYKKEEEEETSPTRKA